MRHHTRAFQRLTGFPWTKIVPLAILVLFAGAALLSWDWLRDAQSTDRTESNVSTLSKIAAIVGGGIALWVAWRRSNSADRQADAAQNQIRIAQGQIEIAQSQIEIAQHSMRNERFQKGAEMLGSETLAVRIGAVYALSQLASEHPEIYHLQVMKLFAAFVSHPPSTTEISLATTTIRCRSDVFVVLEAMTIQQSDEQVEIEKQEGYQPDLRSATVEVSTLYANMRRADPRFW